jgi:uncharacterized membrane protein (UPF0127 family)
MRPLFPPVLFISPLMRLCFALLVAEHRWRRVFFGLLAVSQLMPCMFSSATAKDRNPTLPQIELRAGMHRIMAELATDDETRSKGLMFRDQLAPNHGMLFIFQHASPYCFWMKNTTLPLSIAFLRDDGTIVNIADMQALSEKSHCAREPVRFALEMEQGWFARKGIREGSRIGNQKLFGAP